MWNSALLNSSCIQEFILEQKRTYRNGDRSIRLSYFSYEKEDSHAKNGESIAIVSFKGSLTTKFRVLFSNSISGIRVVDDAGMRKLN